MISLSILAYINSMLSGPCFAGHLRDELSKCLRATKYVEVRIDRVFIDRFHENRTALPAIRQEPAPEVGTRSEEHTSELQSHLNLVCRLLLEKQNQAVRQHHTA